MVCVLSDVVEGLMVVELPVTSMSPASEQLWSTPCSFAELPVLAVCWSVGDRFALLPSLAMRSDGEADPLWILRSENSWELGGQLGAAVLLAVLLLPVPPPVPPVPPPVPLVPPPVLPFPWQVPPTHEVSVGQQTAVGPEPQTGCPLGQMHVPPLQVVPLGQQVLPQTWLVAQHAPLTQVCPLGQQVVPQTWLAAQHAPLTQVCPLEQQVVPQTWLAAQHAPLTQVCPLGQQVVPQTWLVEQHTAWATHEVPVGQQIAVDPEPQTCPLGQVHVPVPWLQVAPIGQQVAPQTWGKGQHTLRPAQTCPGPQHVPLQHFWVSQHEPPQHSSKSTQQVLPQACAGEQHAPLTQTCGNMQQIVPPPQTRLTGLTGQHCPAMQTSMPGAQGGLQSSAWAWTVLGIETCPKTMPRTVPASSLSALLLETPLASPLASSSKACSSESASRCWCAPWPWPSGGVLMLSVTPFLPDGPSSSSSSSSSRPHLGVVIVNGFEVVEKG